MVDDKIRESTTLATPVANPRRSVDIAHKMASEGVWYTPLDTMFPAIYNDLQGFATRGNELESGQF